MKLSRALLLVAIGAAWAQVPAEAQIPGYNPWKQSETVWKQRDICRRNAFKQFPDYTPEGNAKRDRAEQRCLESNNLPTPPPQAPRESSGSSRR